MSYLERIQDIYTHIGQGKAMDAFEKYYHSNCDMILEDGTKVEGKDANREREIEFFSSVEEFHGLDIKAINSNEDDATTAVECVMDVTFKGGDRMQIQQVATQQWEDGHIVKERFYGTQ
ncbi:SnoaL-like domain-containing protein [Balneola vulgaris]|uniref:SnoaL-like domain-containing protein n=1 Tax=Balneola vulgaris TaxID=287535 RepID=UPI000370CE38|nr:SnoaL-like domain-containing protein [Balneola vulgaris]